MCGFLFSSRRRHTRFKCDWSSDVCSSDLVAVYQMILPGEWARAHRHTPNALRLILDAEPGTYTQVDGVDIAMEPGDVLLTPNWSTHGHGNRGNASAYWLDFLDVPLVQLLEPMFFEVAEDEKKTLDQS